MCCVKTQQDPIPPPKEILNLEILNHFSIVNGFTTPILGFSYTFSFLKSIQVCVRFFDDNKLFHKQACCSTGKYDVTKFGLSLAGKFHNVFGANPKNVRFTQLDLRDLILLRRNISFELFNNTN
jgi:hypothetical protein